MRSVRMHFQQVACFQCGALVRVPPGSPPPQPVGSTTPRRKRCVHRRTKLCAERHSGAAQHERSLPDEGKPARGTDTSMTRCPSFISTRQGGPGLCSNSCSTRSMASRFVRNVPRSRDPGPPLAWVKLMNALHHLSGSSCSTQPSLHSACPFQCSHFKRYGIFPPTAVDSPSAV